MAAPGVKKEELCLGKVFLGSLEFSSAAWDMGNVIPCGVDFWKGYERDLFPVLRGLQ